MRAASAIAAAALVLGSAMAHGQEVSAVRDTTRREEAPGLSTGVHTFNDGFGGTVAVDYVEVVTAHPQVLLSLHVPPGGPNVGAPLETLGADKHTVARLGWAPLPGLRDDWALRGMIQSEGRLYAWPPAGEQLILHAEGAAERRTLTAGTMTLFLPDGTQRPIHSLNGELPPGAGELSIYTGELFARDLPAVAWPDTLLVVPLIPEAPGADPHALFLVTDDSPRGWRTGAATLKPKLSATATEATLLVRMPAEPALLEQLREGATVRVDAVPDPRTATASAVLPAGETVREGGEWHPGAERRLFRNAVALDEAGQRLLFLSVGDNPGRARTVAPLAGLESMLRQRDFPDLMLLPDREPLLALQSRGEMPARTTPVRLAVAVASGRKVFAIADRSGNLKRLRPTAAQNSPGSFPGNLPSAAVDGRYARDGRLNHFWAARVDTPRPPDAMPLGDEEPGVLRFLFPQTARLAVVEVVHAEAVGFSPAFDLKAYRLVGRARADQPWQTLVEVRHDTPVARDRLTLQGSPRVREIRLVVDTPSFLPAGDTARVAEIIFWGE